METSVRAFTWLAVMTISTLPARAGQLADELRRECLHDNVRIVDLNTGATAG